VVTSREAPAELAVVGGGAVRTLQSLAAYGMLAEQLNRSSAPEQRVLRVLADEREPVTLAELLAMLEGPPSAL